MSAPRRVAIVHPDEQVRSRLVEVVHNAGMDVAGVAANAADGRQMVDDADADVVIVGLHLDGVDGIQLIRLLIADDHQRRVVVYANIAYSLFAERALEAGACGYVLASRGEDVLTAALRTVFDGGLHLDAELARRVVPDFAPGSPLTADEREVVHAFRAGATTPEAVARALEISQSTAHRIERGLARKLGVYSRAGVRLYAHRSSASASAPDMDSASA